MPSPAAIDAFIAQVISGDHAGAIRDWYAEDATMQENQAEPRAGREGLIAREQAVLDRMETVQTEILAPPLVAGDHVAIRWRFTFLTKAGARIIQEEVAWQTWRGDKVWRETFFYDPAQRTPVAT